MRVIESGTKQWCKQIVCKGCKALLEADGEDLQYKVTDATAQAQQYQEEIEGDFFISCPECGQEIKIKNIPPSIKEQIKSS